jgi:hypothetical protein
LKSILLVDERWYLQIYCGSKLTIVSLNVSYGGVVYIKNTARGKILISANSC